jgi:prophage antirepressor-like protein
MALTISGNVGNFPFMGRSIRFVILEGEPWFVSKDCAAVLGIQRHITTIAEYPDSEKAEVTINNERGGPQKTTVLSMPGLFRMTFQSRKNEAEVFKTYIYTEVLPAIHKTGKYETRPALPEPAPEPQHTGITLGDLAEVRKADAEASKRKLDELRKTVFEHERAISNLKNEISMTEKEYDAHRTLFLAALRPVLDQAAINVPPVRRPDRDEIILREAMRLAHQEPVNPAMMGLPAGA